MDSEDEQRRAWFRREVVPLEPALRAYAHRFCRGGPDEVEDLVHDVFAKLIVYEGWRGVTNVGAFAARTMKNIALDTVRRRKIVAFDLSADLDRFGFADEAPIADRVLEGHDDLKTLARLIGELPPQCRRAFTLCKVYGLSHAEIAARLGLSVSTVEKHVMRGLRFCSEHLAREPSRRSGSNLGRIWSRTRARGEKG